MRIWAMRKGNTPPFHLRSAGGRCSVWCCPRDRSWGGIRPCWRCRSISRWVRPGFAKGPWPRGPCPAVARRTDEGFAFPALRVARAFADKENFRVGVPNAERQVGSARDPGGTVCNRRCGPGDGPSARRWRSSGLSVKWERTSGVVREGISLAGPPETFA